MIKQFQVSTQANSSTSTTNAADAEKGLREKPTPPHLDEIKLKRSTRNPSSLGMAQSKGKAEEPTSNHHHHPQQDSNIKGNLDNNSLAEGEERETKRGSVIIPGQASASGGLVGLTSPLEEVVSDGKGSESSSPKEERLMLRIRMPEANMARMVQFGKDVTVRKAIELLFRRNPMGAVEEYGLFLADHYDSGLHASGTTSEDCDGDCHEGVWLDDAELLANLNIGPEQLVLLKRKPRAVVVTLEDGKHKTVLIEKHHSVNKLIETILEDVIDPIQRERQLFDYELYLTMKAPTLAPAQPGSLITPFSPPAIASPPPANSSISTSPPSSPTPSSSSIESNWVSRDKTIASYNMHNLPTGRYCLEWKKKPHIVKVQLHPKIFYSGITTKTMKYFYDTTAKQAIEYLVGKYLSDTENPCEYSLRKEECKKDEKSGTESRMIEALISPRGGGTSMRVKEKQAVFRVGGTGIRPVNFSNSPADADKEEKTDDSKSPHWKDVAYLKLGFTKDDTYVSGIGEQCSGYEEGFWLDEDDTLSQYNFSVKDLLHLKINPSKMAEESISHIAVSFFQCDHLQKVLSSITNMVDSGESSAGNDKQSVMKSFAVDHLYRKQFSYDFNTTVADLLAQIKNFLTTFAEKTKYKDKLGDLDAYGLLMKTHSPCFNEERWLDPSSNILALCITPEEDVFFTRRDATSRKRDRPGAMRYLGPLISTTTNGLHYSVSVPSLGGQFSLLAEPDDLVSQVKEKILSMLATYNAPEARRRTSSNLGIKLEELELFLSPPHGGDNGTWLEDDRSLISYLIGPGAQLQFKKKNGEKQLSSLRSVIHVDVSQYTDFCGQQNLEIPFKPTQTTARKVMQHLSKILSPENDSFFKDWHNSLCGPTASLQSQTFGLFCQAKEDAGSLWLDLPDALLTDCYHIQPGDNLKLKRRAKADSEARPSREKTSTLVISVDIPTRGCFQTATRSHHKQKKKTFSFEFSANTLVENALLFVSSKVAEDRNNNADAERTDEPEEDEEWWDERWKMLATGEAHIETLKKWFGLFADEGLKLSASFSVKGVFRRTGQLFKNSFWLSPSRTISSYGLRDQDVVELRVRPVEVRVGYKGNHRLTLSLDPRCPVSDLLYYAELNKPQNILDYHKSQNQSLWCPHECCETEDSSESEGHRPGFWLSAERSLAFYLLQTSQSSLDVQLKVHKEKCLFEFMDGTKQMFLVDYSKPLKNVLSSLSKNDSALSRKLCQADTASLRIYSRTTKLRIDLNKSLKENGLSAVTALVVVNKQLRLQAQSLTNSNGSLPLRRTNVEIGRRNSSRSDFNADLEIIEFIEEVEKDEKNLSTNDIDENWIAAAERAGLGLSVWKEPPDNPSNIVIDKHGNIKSATLNKLIIRMTATSSETYDPKAIGMFLLTYQSFTTPVILLNKLIERYRVPSSAFFPSISECEFKDKVVNTIRFRVVNVLVQWIETCFDDFDAFLLTKLNKFVQITLPADGHHQLAKKLSKALSKKSSVTPDSGLKQFKFLQEPPSPKVPRNINLDSTCWLDIDEEEIARQLTIIDFELFSRIKHKELLREAWNKPKLQHLAPNVLATVHRFNQVSGWVASMIVSPELLKNRVRAMTKLINIAKCLHSLNNFGGLMAFIAGWNTSSVLRLKWTIKELSKKTSEVRDFLEAVMGSEYSWRNYRTALREANPPCVPYIGVYLQDLLFIEEGNPDNSEEGLINFYKRILVSNVIRELQQYQQQGYNLVQVPKIGSILLTAGLKTCTDDELYSISLAREPRGADRSSIA